MKALAWITTALCITYGAIALIIYQTKHADVLEESKSLREIEAKVEGVQRCPGKSLCYQTIVSYQTNDKVITAKVLGEHGKDGAIISIWTKPGAPKGYDSPSAFIEQSMVFFPLFFLPTALIILPLLLALQGKSESTKPSSQ
ncbi:hypothetical protein [Diaphorobacter sp. ED-3]|uniref:hypothetical protein n=1 Tax=Diaphorobacter sp. ED-3 TaxID=3016636 RepID=UPI0022DE5137|nr:hypothetical protein [Diaphorobacter sp. ED-3]